MSARPSLGVSLCGRRTMLSGPVPEVVQVLEAALLEARAGHLVGVSIAKVVDGAMLKVDGVFACRGGVQPALQHASVLMAHTIEEHQTQ